jgi:hypothetical protein
MAHKVEGAERTDLGQMEYEDFMAEIHAIVESRDKRRSRSHDSKTVPCFYPDADFRNWSAIK